jgi:hypothetical protein
MKSKEVGTTLKQPETINGNVKNLSKRIKRKDKEMSTFTSPYSESVPRSATLPTVTRSIPESLKAHSLDTLSQSTIPVEERPLGGRFQQH